MTSLPLNRILFVVALAATFTPVAAQARIILADANFDNRPSGVTLARGGALAGEPVAGPHDRTHDFIVQQGPGDMAVQLPDNQLFGRSEMYWAFRQDLQIEGGLVTARIEFTPHAVGDYTIALRAADQLTDFLAIDVVDVGSAGRYVWRDADSPTGTFFGFAATGSTDDIRIEVKVAQGTYSLWWNGSAVVADEPHGLVGEAITNLVVGHAADANLAGEFEYDLVQLDWRPDDTAVDLLVADFSDKPEGQPLQYRGAEFGEPVSYSGINDPVVESGLPNGNKAMVVRDDDPTACSARYEFLGSAEPTSQPLSLSFALAADMLESYNIFLREQGSSARVFLNIRLSASGTISFSDAASGGAFVATASYSAGQQHTVELAFEPGLDVYSVWVDNERVIHRRSHGVTDRDVGRITFGCGADSNLDGTLRIDRILAHTLDDPVASAADDLPRSLVSFHGAAPNPFNPSTSVRFDLARPGNVSLDIFDSRGRHVRRLVNGVLEAGHHARPWQGRNDAGQAVASGVYHARLVSGGVVESRALTLVK